MTNMLQGFLMYTILLPYVHNFNQFPISNAIYASANLSYVNEYVLFSYISDEFFIMWALFVSTNSRPLYLMKTLLLHQALVLVPSDMTDLVYLYLSLFKSCSYFHQPFRLYTGKWFLRIIINNLVSYDFITNLFVKIAFCKPWKEKGILNSSFLFFKNERSNVYVSLINNSVLFFNSLYWKW